MTHDNSLIEVTSDPQESLRLDVPGEYLRDGISKIQTHTQGVPAEIIFNLDEMCNSPWEDINHQKFHIKIGKRDINS